MSDIKGNAADAVDKYGDKIGNLVDKAGDFLDSKTGGKHSAQIDQGADKLKDALDGLDGKNDDIGPDDAKDKPAEPTSPTEPGLPDTSSEELPGGFGQGPAQ